jgi:hypothetical protein
MSAAAQDSHKQREQAWQVMQAALAAVEPGAAVRRHLRLEDGQLSVGAPGNGG